MSSFNLRLLKAIEKKQSHLCVGLDISPEALNSKSTSIEDLKAHTFKVIDATHDLAVAYKPNLAFFERWGSKGFEWLEKTIEYFPDNSIIIGDAKRGDIGNTAIQYAKSLFVHFNFDAVTLSPFMGKDSISPFIEDPNKGAFILCRTSNSSATDFQNLITDNISLFDRVAQLALRWNINNNIGLVVGATFPEEIARVRSMAPQLPFLIPGVGAQGGNLKKSIINGNKNGSALINISRGISFAEDLSSSSIKRAASDYLNKMRDIMNGE